MRSILKWLAIFLLWWALTAIVYSRVESNFLRAESGWDLFMVMQLLWLTLTSLALLGLIKMVERPTQAHWPWLAVSAAYGSLNVLGLGLITVAATATVLGGLLFSECRNNGSKKLAIPLAVLAVGGA